MQLRLMDPDLIRKLAETNGEAREGQLEFVFDDESLEHILYGDRGEGPTPAGLFGIGNRHVQEMRAALRLGNHDAVVADCAALAACGCPLSIGTCRELAAVLKTIVPQVPNPVLRVELGPLRPLLEKIWDIAIEKADTDLQKQGSAPLYRWYEHQGMYDDARRILNRLIEINTEQGELSGEAVSRNNLGFEYLLEGRFQEAMEHFEKAARLFEQVGSLAQCANSRANHWICLFERGETGNLDQAETELEKLAESLTHFHFWQARKPYVLLARISEKRGRLRKAVELVKRAIQSAAGSGTRYPETDAEYLKSLEAKLASRRSPRRRRSGKT